MPGTTLPSDQESKFSRGKGKKEGFKFRPLSAAEMPAAPAKLILRHPARPRRTTPYPIDLDTFTRLKTSSVKPSISRAAKARATLTPDRLRAGPGSAAPAAPALAAAAGPTINVSFAGIPATGWFPFDCAVAAGLDQVVCAVNSSVNVYSKTGTVLAGQTLDGWFAGTVQNATIFDPKLIFDPVNSRFVLLAVATDQNNSSWFLLSVSHTADATGPWWNYALDATVDGETKTNNWADYPSLGQDADSLFLTANMFQVDGGFQYAKLRIVPKQSVYSGGTPTYHDVTGLVNADGSPVFTLQPCNTLGPSPAEYLVNSLFPTGANPNPSSVTLWSVANGAVNPTLQSTTVSTVPYGLPPHADQPGGVQSLDTGDTRALHAVSAGGAVWMAFNSLHDWDGAANTAAIHWLQMNPAGGAPVQEGIFGAAGLHYFYPALMLNAGGDLLLVFSRCGAAEPASIYCTKRANADPPGTLAGSVLVKAGTGPYVQVDQSGRNRWGDYAGASPDPQEGAAVWLYSGCASGPSQWSTQATKVA